jgi:hypothetical protein
LRRKKKYASTYVRERLTVWSSKREEEIISVFRHFIKQKTKSNVQVFCNTKKDTCRKEINVIMYTTAMLPKFRNCTYLSWLLLQLLILSLVDFPRMIPLVCSFVPTSQPIVQPPPIRRQANSGIGIVPVVLLQMTQTQHHHPEQTQQQQQTQQHGNILLNSQKIKSSSSPLFSSFLSSRPTNRRALLQSTATAVAATTTSAAASIATVTMMGAASTLSPQPSWAAPPIAIIAE